MEVWAVAKRKAISTRTRFEVFKRDRFTCQYCGRTPPLVVLHVDHITPVSHGGDNDEGNLLTSCKDCNLGKSNVPLTEAPLPLQQQIAERREKAQQLAAYNEFLMEERAIADEQIKHLGCHWHNLQGFKKDTMAFGNERESSIRVFMRSLPVAEIFDSIDIAHARRPVRDKGYDHYTWKYFCGVCWKKIRDANGGETRRG